MADTQEQSLGTMTPVDGTYFRLVGDPGGTPDSSNATGTAVKAYLKTYNDTLYYGLANVSFVASAFAKTSDTTLADVTGLTFTTASGGKYRFKAFLFITNGASGGSKIAISGTNTATDIKYFTDFRTAAVTEHALSTALDEAEGETALHIAVIIDGFIHVNEGGTLTVQYAQNASNGTASKVLAGSWFEVDKIG